MTITQCWFCNALFLTDPGDPNPLCVSCGIGPRPAALQARAGAGPVLPNVVGVGPPRPVQLVPVREVALSVSEPAPMMHPPLGLMQPPLGTPSTSLQAPNGDDIEATILHVRAFEPTWLLEFDHGVRLPLTSDNVLLGRRPKAGPDDTATLLVIPDLGKVLSRTHARLRRDPVADIWTIEDLRSANGVAILNGTDSFVDVAPMRPVPATAQMMLGTLRVRLRRHDDTLA